MMYHLYGPKKPHKGVPKNISFQFTQIAIRCCTLPSHLWTAISFGIGEKIKIEFIETSLPSRREVIKMIYIIN